MIEIRLLRYFLAIAREQTITRAAESLHVAQSTLSKQMMELEAQLGKRLLVRGKRQVTLTEEGQFLRKQAQEIMALMDKTESAFYAGDNIVGGDIYLGCAETPAMEAITQVFRSIHADYPAVQLHIFSGDAENVIEKLDKGLLDVGILLGPAIYERFDYLTLPYRDTFGLLMPADCPLAGAEAVPLEALEELPLLVSQQTRHGIARAEWFGSRYDRLHIVATYNLIYNATHLVEQGLGYAVCLKGLVETGGRRGLVFRPFEPPLEVDIVAVSKKYQPFSPATKVFMQRLAALAAPGGRSPASHPNSHRKE